MMVTMMMRPCHRTASNSMLLSPSTIMRYFNSNRIAVRCNTAVMVRSTITTTTIPQHQLHPSQYRRLYHRNLSSNSSHSVETDWVRTAIQKMIMDQQQQQQTPPETTNLETISAATVVSPLASTNTGTTNGSIPSSTLLSDTTTTTFENSDLEKSLQSLQVRKYGYKMKTYLSAFCCLCDFFCTHQNVTISLNLQRIPVF